MTYQIVTDDGARISNISETAFFHMCKDFTPKEFQGCTIYHGVKVVDGISEIENLRKGGVK